MCAQAHVCVVVYDMDMYRGQRTSSVRIFSLFTMWVLGNELGQPGLVANVLSAHSALPSPHFSISKD